MECLHVTNKLNAKKKNCTRKPHTLYKITLLKKKKNPWILHWLCIFTPRPPTTQEPGQCSFSSGMRSKRVRGRGEGGLYTLRRYSGYTESLYTFRKRRNSFPDDLCRLKCDWAALEGDAVSECVSSISIGHPLPIIRPFSWLVICVQFLMKPTAMPTSIPASKGGKKQWWKPPNSSFQKGTPNQKLKYLNKNSPSSMRAATSV